MKMPRIAHTKLTIAGAALLLTLTAGGAHAVTTNHSSSSTNKSTSSSQSKSAAKHTSSKPKTYVNSKGNTVESPDSNSDGATAQCNDGTYSHSQSAQGTCSSHGGEATTSAAPPAPTVPTCNTTSEASYTASYNAAKASADSTHASNIASIQSSWNARGLPFSGGEQQDEANENARYQAQLSSLQAQYQQELAGINC